MVIRFSRAFSLWRPSDTSLYWFICLQPSWLNQLLSLNDSFALSHWVCFNIQSTEPERSPKELSHWPKGLKRIVSDTDQNTDRVCQNPISNGRLFCKPLFQFKRLTTPCTRRMSHSECVHSIPTLVVRSFVWHTMFCDDHLERFIAYQFEILEKPILSDRKVPTVGIDYLNAIWWFWVMLTLRRIERTLGGIGWTLRGIDHAHFAGRSPKRQFWHA